MNNPRSQEKSFAISKQLVWEAWRQVKVDKGAAGVDGQDLDSLPREDARLR